MTLVCFAVKEEANAFQKLAGASDVQVLVTGMGRRNAEKTFRARVENEKPELVITSGFAGGLNPALSLGDVVYDADASVTIISALATAGGRPAKFVCVEKVASTAREKQTLRAASGADAVEMESEAIRGICRAAKIPSATVRVILDTAGEDLALDFNEFMDENQRLNTAKLAWAVVRSPLKIGALLQLRKNSKAAAERLAQVLNAIL
jgi:adenosylhomocysteine nucleosidase